MKLSKQEQEWVNEMQTADKAMQAIRKTKATRQAKQAAAHSIEGCEQKAGTCVFESPFFGNGFHIDLTSEKTQAARAERGQAALDAFLEVAKFLGAAMTKNIAEAVEIGRKAGVKDAELADMISSVIHGVHDITSEGAARMKLPKKLLDMLEEIDKLEQKDKEED